jgi:hypothetical protein
VDAAVLVHGDLVALHDPFEGGFAVHHVLVGFERDAGEGDAGVVRGRVCRSPRTRRLRAGCR